MKFDYTMPEEPEQSADDAYPERWIYDEDTDRVLCAHCGVEGGEVHQPGCCLDEEHPI